MTSTITKEEREQMILAALNEYLLQKLKIMQTEKKATNVEPYWVTQGDLFKAIDGDVRKVLNFLFTKRTIKVHKTIHAANQNFVELVEE